jgi:hypothetical protein
MFRCRAASYKVHGSHKRLVAALVPLASLLRQGGSRDHDEVQQLVAALSLLLDELMQLPEAQPANKAAAGPGDGTAAAADAAKDDEAAVKARSHGALPAHAVSAIRDGLTKAGVADKLPPACRKVRMQLQLRPAGMHVDWWRACTCVLHNLAIACRNGAWPSAASDQQAA